MMDDLLMHAPALLIALPLIGAFLTPLIDRVNSKARSAWVILVLIVTQVIMMLFAWDVFTQGTHIYTMGAADPATTIPVQAAVPIRIVFEVDGMSAFMGLISCTVALAAAVYSLSSMNRESGQGRFFTLLLLMTVGMLGLEFTGDMFNLFVFLEILSIASAGLIAFRFYQGESVEGAFKYIVISTLAALMVLFSIGLFYGQYNVLNLAALANALEFGFLDKLALGLLVAAFAMKCGAVPMHMWKPDAYQAASAPVAALLVAGGQAGIYALFRVCFTLYGATLDASLIGVLLVALGLLSIFVGVTMALLQVDLKRLIGYAAVAEVGYILLGVGVGLYESAEEQISDFGVQALQGGVFHVFNDALDVGLLFLVAGAVIYATRESNMNKLGGLAHSMKYSSIFFLIGLAAISGLPPLNGFASKLLIYESVFRLSPILSIVAILASILMLAIFVKIFHAVFMGPRLSVVPPRDVPRSMLLGMAILAAGIIFIGLFPDWMLNNVVQPAAQALLDQAGYIGSVGGV